MMYFIWISTNHNKEEKRPRNYKINCVKYDSSQITQITKFVKNRKLLYKLNFIIQKFNYQMEHNIHV